LCVVLAGFSVVGSRTEDNHGNGEEEEEHAEFSHARLDRESEDAKTVRVFRQLEDAEDAQDAREEERAASFLAAWTNAGRQQVHRLCGPRLYACYSNSNLINTLSICQYCNNHATGLIRQASKQASLFAQLINKDIISMNNIQGQAARKAHKAKH